MILIKKKILLIVTGGIACYKALDLIRRLQDTRASIECILTNNAKEFVSALSFESLLGKKTYSNLFSLDQEKKMNHIKLAKEADGIVVVPCTANFLAKMANGIADDLATNVLLASDKKKIIAPAMNSNMWKNNAVRKNMRNLENMGIKILNPQSGLLACGTLGTGKLMDVEQIVEEISKILNEKNVLSGLKAIVTAGPSIEKIDPIRYISNFSSGIQGFSIAEKLSDLGAETILVSGPTSLSDPKNVKLIKVESGVEFLDCTLSHLPSDIFISVAAISDWKTNRIAKHKLKKNDEKNLNIRLSRNIDVLRNISVHQKRPKLVIGFSAETSNLIKNSTIKLKEKKCDWIVANKISPTNYFGSEKNKVYFINKNKTEEWPTMKKTLIAKKLSKKIVSFFKNNRLLKYE